jgi:hypothetical protein
MQISCAVSFPVSTPKCTLIGHMGFQPLTTDSRSNPTPEGFEPLTKSSRSNSPTNCTLWQLQGGFGGEMRCGEDGCAILFHLMIFVPTLTQWVTAIIGLNSLDQI